MARTRRDDLQMVHMRISKDHLRRMDVMMEKVPFTNRTEFLRFLLDLGILQYERTLGIAKSPLEVTTTGTTETTTGTTETFSTSATSNEEVTKNG